MNVPGRYSNCRNDSLRSPIFDSISVRSVRKAGIQQPNFVNDFFVEPFLEPLFMAWQVLAFDVVSQPKEAVKVFHLRLQVGLFVGEGSAETGSSL